jgi:regulator of protease activity HflC (stomatin/prohibitin superfamily)
MIKGLGSLLLIGLLGTIVVSYMFGQIVPPGTMGVRQITFGPYRGFSKEALHPGYHWSVPFYSTVHLVPQTIQTLTLDRHSMVRGHGGAVEVQTTDGSSVDVDISILSSFYSNQTAEHGGPADLIQRIGVSEGAWRDRLRTACVNELRKFLGRLSTSEFYDPAKRESAIADTNKALNSRLAEFGIRVEAILLRRYTYSEERIDTAIFQKNLQDQEERLNEASSRFSQAKADLEKVSAEWDAKIKTLEVEGQNKARVTHSEADLYETQKRANADFLIAKAKADVDKLKAEALSKSAGAQVYVGKQLAPLLGSLKGGLLGELDPYDLNAWLAKFGTRGVVER